MKKQFVVFGLNRFGASAAKTMEENGIQVMAIDRSHDRVHAIADLVSHAIQADVTDEEAMEDIGLQHMDGAVIAMNEDMEASIVIAMKCKECGIPQVIATGKNETHGKILEKLGVDRVVYPEQEMGIRVGKLLTANDILDWINLSKDYSLVEMAVPKAWVGRSFAQLGLRKNYGMNVAGVRIDNDGSAVLSGSPVDCRYEAVCNRKR